jgi:hypothetical protein
LQTLINLPLTVCSFPIDFARDASEDHENWNKIFSYH